MNSSQGTHRTRANHILIQNVTVTLATKVPITARCKSKGYHGNKIGHKDQTAHILEVKYDRQIVKTNKSVSFVVFHVPLTLIRLFAFMADEIHFKHAMMVGS